MSKKKVRVKIGNMPTLVETQRLLGHVGGGPKQKAPPQGSIKIQVHASPESQAKQNCDLRGMNSEEALVALEDFISQAIVNRIGKGIIIHGHGMGTIKGLARDYLESTGVCKSFNKGSRHEGGDGVTVVEFDNWDR